jgi:hypothetical protein
MEHPIGPNNTNEKLYSLSVTFDLENDESWLRLHRVDGRCLLPAAVYLYLVWECVKLEIDKQCIFIDFSIPDH